MPKMFPVTDIRIPDGSVTSTESQVTAEFRDSKNSQYFFNSLKSAMTLSGHVWRSWISCGMNSVWGRTPPARDVELSAYNKFAQTDDKTLLPSRLSSGRDCWIFATLTCNLFPPQRKHNF